MTGHGHPRAAIMLQIKGCREEGNAQRDRLRESSKHPNINSICSLRINSSESPFPLSKNLLDLIAGNNLDW